MVRERLTMTRHKKKEICQAKQQDRSRKKKEEIKIKKELIPKKKKKNFDFK